MKRIIIAAGAALLTAVPATLGLIGNTSFAQNVPVRVPSQASVLNDDGTLRDAHATEPGDDKGGLTTHVEPGDDKGSDSGAVKDDNGGHGGQTSGTDTSGSGGTNDGSGHS